MWSTTWFLDLCLWAPQSEFYSEKRLLSEDIAAYVHYKAPLNQTAGDEA